MLLAMDAHGRHVVRYVYREHAPIRDAARGGTRCDWVWQALLCQWTNWATDGGRLPHLKSDCLFVAERSERRYV